MNSRRVWTTFVAVSAVLQLGSLGFQGVREYRRARQWDEMQAGWEATNAQRALEQAQRDVARLAASNAPAAGSTGSVAPGIGGTQGAPAVAAGPRAGVLSLAQLTRAEIVARTVAAGIEISTDDPDVQLPVVAKIYGFSAIGGVIIELVDCARAPAIACSANAERTIVAQSGSDSAFLAPLLTDAIHDASDLRDALAAAGMRPPRPQRMDHANGMRQFAVSGYSGHSVNAYVRELTGLAEEHGLVHTEGNATLSITSGDYPNSAHLLDVILGRAER